MADLVYRVRADYKELEVLRAEISETVNQMKQFNQNTPKAEVEAMSNKYAGLLKRYEEIMSRVGRYGVFFEEAMRNVGNIVKDSVNDFKDLTNEAEKRLAVEEKVNAALKSMRDDVKAQRDAMKASGVKDSSQEWQAITEKLQVYENLLSSSNVVIENIRNSISSVKDTTNGIGGHFEDAKKNAEDYLNTIRQGANDSIDKLNDLVEASEKLEDSLSNNKGKSIEEMSRGVSEYEDALRNSADAAEQAYKAQEQYIEGIRARLNEITETVNNTNDKTIISELNKEAEELNFDLTNSEMILGQIKKINDDIEIKIANLGEVKETIDAFGELKSKISQYGKVLGDVKMGTDEATRAFENYASKTTSLSEDIKGSLRSIAALAGIAFGLHEVKSFISDVAETRIYFQDIESSMKVFLGSEQKSAEFTQKLKDYAWFNMFEFSDLAKASQQMIAYGQDVDSIIPKLDMLSNVAAGTHAPLMEMVDAYNRAKSTGVVDAMGIKSWATKGVVIKDVLKEMGDTATSTTITFEQLNKVLEHITGEGGMFHNLMAEQLENISAEKGQLEDNLANMYNEIGEKLQGAITKWYKLQSDMVDNYKDIAGDGTIDFVVNVAETGMDELMEHWKEMMEYIKTAIAVYGSWRVALVAVNAVHMAQEKILGAVTVAERAHLIATTNVTTAKKAEAAATVLANNAVKAFNRSILASPLTWYAVALTGVVYGIYKLVTATSAADMAKQSLAKTMDDLNEEQQTYNEETKDALSAAQSDAAATNDRKEAMDLLIARYPEIIKKYIDEKGQLRDILAFKKEIAEFDADKQRREKTEKYKSTYEDNQKIVQELIGIRSREGVSLNISKAQRAADKKRKLELQKLFKEQTGGGGVFGTATIDQMINYYSTLSNDSKRQYARNLTENKIYDFTKEGGSLENYTETQLQSLLKKLKDNNSKDKKNSSVFISELGDYLTYQDRESLVTRVSGMLQAREKPIGAEVTYKGLKESFNKQKKTLDTLQKNMKNGVTTYVKKVDDSWEIVAKGTEGAVVAQQQHYEDIKKASEAATSAFKAEGGDVKTDKKDKSILQTRQKEYDLYLSNREQQQKQEIAAFNEAEEARIAAIENATIREQEARKNQFRLTEQSIKEQEEAFKKANVEQEKAAWQNKNKDKIWADTKEAQDIKANGYVNIPLTADQQSQIDSMRKKNLEEEKRYYKELELAQIQSLLDYQKEYGDFQVQRAAITKEYDLKIATEQDEIQKAALERQRERLLSELSMKELQQSLDWETVFNNLEYQSVEALRTLKKQLAQALDAKDITAENAKVLAEKIREIEDAIARKTDVWSSWIPGLRERKRLTQEILEVEQQIRGLTTVRNTRGVSQDKAISQFVGAINEKSGANISEGAFRQQWQQINSGNLEDIRERYKAEIEDSEEVRKAFEVLVTTTTDLSKAQEELEQAQANQKARQDALKNFTKSGNVGQYFKDVTAGMDATGIFGLVNQNAQSANALLGNIGLGDTEFGKGFADFAEGMQGFQNGVQSLMQGDVFGAINGVVDGIQGFGKVIGRAFGVNWTGGNEKEVAETTERLTKQNEELTRSVDALRDVMDKSYGDKALATYQKALEAQETINKNQMEILEAQMGYHSAHHSNAYYADDNEIRKYNKQAQEAMRTAGVEISTITGLKSIYNLTPEQLKAIKDFAPDLWRYLTEVGKYDKSEYWDAVVEQAGKAEELTEQIMTIMTTQTEESVFSQFLSQLKELANGSKTVFTDIANDWQDMVNEMVVNNFIGDEYQEKLKEWRKKIYELNKKYKEGSVTLSQFKNGLSQLENEYTTYVKEARSEIDDYRAVGVIANPDKKAEQSATANSISNISYDQADSLVGIGMAQQMAIEQSRDRLDILNTRFDDVMGGMAEQRNISADSREILAGMAIHVEEIRDGVVDTIVPRIKTMSDDLSKVRKYVEEQ